MSLDTLQAVSIGVQPPETQNKTPPFIFTVKANHETHNLRHFDRRAYRLTFNRGRVGLL